MGSMVFLGLYFEKYPNRTTAHQTKVRNNIVELMKACGESKVMFQGPKGCKILLGMPEFLQTSPAMQELKTVNDTTKNLFIVNDPPKKQVDLSKPLEATAKTNRIAELRNSLMGHAQRMFADTKFLTVFDGDGIVKFDEPTMEAVEKALKTSDQWDALTFNDDHYYDFFALRCKADTPNCYHFGYNCKRGGLKNPDGTPRFQCLHELKDTVKMAKVPEEQNFVTVSSAFNGLAIYKAKSVQGCAYDGTDVENGMDCEHVAFNRCIGSKGGKLVMSGISITTYRGARSTLFAELPDNVQEIPGYGLINTKTGQGLDDDH